MFSTALATSRFATARTGFSCFVDRQTPLNLEPTCFDAEGTATTFPTRLFVEEKRAKGETEEQIQTQIEAGYKSGKFLAPRKPGIVYMMSDSGVLYIADKNVLVHIPPHLMFYAPYATDKDLGSPPPAANMPHLIRAGPARRILHRRAWAGNPLRSLAPRFR
jgi:hypothetical protein